MEFKFIDEVEYRHRIPEFQELFRICFNRDISKEFLEWRYINNPIKDMLINVALENDKIIANYSASPCKICINGKVEKAALSMTTMTHPNFSGQGLFTKLAEGLYEKMIKNDYRAVIGFPNNNSHMTFIKKLHWKDVYEIPTMKLDLSKINRIQIYNKFEVKNDKEFLLNYSNLNNSNNKAKIYKDLEYLKWRFRDNPVNNYDNYILAENEVVLSSIITKRFNKDEIDVVEINSLDDSYSIEILKWIIEMGKVNSIRYINMWCQLKDNFHGIIEKIGFINCEPIVYFGVRDFKENSNILNMYDNWNIQMGDSDVY